MTEVEIVQAIHSFPNGSAGGPDGLRPQHLKDLTSVSAESRGKELLQALMPFVNLMLKGKTPFSLSSPFWSHLDTTGEERGWHKANCC